MSKGVKAGDAYIKVAIDGADQAFRALETRFKGIGNTLGAVGGIATAAGGSVLAMFSGAAQSFAGYGANLDDIKQRTGVSVEALSGLGYAATMTGSDLGTLEKGFIGMAKTMAAASEGAKAKIELFEKLGVTYEQLQGLAPEKQFEVLADRIGQIKDPTERAAIAMQVFGKSGQQLLPMFAGGAAGMREMVAEAERLGLVMSDEDAAAAAALDDTFEQLGMTMGAVWREIGAAVAGPLTEMMNWVVTFVGQAALWLRDNRELVATIAAIAVALTTVGGVLVGAAVGFHALAFIAGGLATGLTAVVGVLGAILSPIGLVVAAIAGAAVYFFGFTEAGREMVASALGYFGELGTIAGDTFGGIRNALAGGDLMAAGEILWAGLQLLWLKGTAPLRETWTGFVRFFKDIWAAAVTTGAEWWNFLTGSLERGWSHSLGFVQDLWSVVYAGLEMGMNNLVAFFETTWARIKGLFGGDATAEIDRINAELAAANDKVAQNRDEAIVARGDAREKALADSKRRQEETARALKEDLDAKFEANAKGQDNALAAAEKKLADAQAKLASLTSEQSAKAAERADAAAKKAAEGAKGANDRNLASKTVGDSGSGTFSVAAIAGLMRLGNEDLADRTAEASERTAAATEKLADMRPLVTAP